MIVTMIVTMIKREGILTLYCLYYGVTELLPAEFSGRPAHVVCHVVGYYFFKLIFFKGVRPKKRLWFRLRDRH